MSVRFWTFLFLWLSIFPMAFANEQNLSEEDYALVQSTYDSCKASPFHTRYKCDCAAVSFLDRVADERNALIRAGD